MVLLRKYFFAAIFFGCLLSSAQNQKLPESWPFWMGSLQLNDTTVLDVPFQFERLGDKGAVFTFVNGKEKISTKEIQITGDSVFVKMPVFDSEFRLKLQKGKMNGVWLNHARNEKNSIPFSAVQFREEAGPMCGFCSHINGKWETTFMSDSSKAVGVFKGNADFTIEGTFMTETGDYRFLAGKMWQEKNGETYFNLGCFDGAHAYLFEGQLKEQKFIEGNFYSGAHHFEKWTAVKNDAAKLRDAETITVLKKDSIKPDFTFPNLKGKLVSLHDARYKNKPVIIQIMGSWCPNCMDETKYLAELYNKYKASGLEVIALAFEKTEDPKKATANVARLKSKFGVNYEMLITGKSGAKKASETFPMLNEISAFPTTIYIGRDGSIKKIYTGYYGPATGADHEKFRKETEEFIKKLLAEK